MSIDLAPGPNLNTFVSGVSPPTILDLMKDCFTFIWTDTLLLRLVIMLLTCGTCGQETTCNISRFVSPDMFGISWPHPVHCRATPPTSTASGSTPAGTPSPPAVTTPRAGECMVPGLGKTQTASVRERRIIHYDVFQTIRLEGRCRGGLLRERGNTFRDQCSGFQRVRPLALRRCRNVDNMGLQLLEELWRYNNRTICRLQGTMTTRWTCGTPWSARGSPCSTVTRTACPRWRCRRTGRPSARRPGTPPSGSGPEEAAGTTTRARGLLGISSYNREH